MNNAQSNVNAAKQGLLIVISGPSGAGKGTICGELLKQDGGLALSVSATTRERKPGEENGREYDFLSDEEFEEKLKRDAFLEWAEVHGRRYGTLKERVMEILDAGKDCVLEIDVQGGLQIERKMKASCVMIFLKAPSEEELIRRITNRNREKPGEIKRRMMTARWEMAQEEKYRYSVVNDRLEDAVKRVLDIIREEREEHASAID